MQVLLPVFAILLVHPLLAQQAALAPIDWKERTRLYTHKFISAQSILDTAPSYGFNHLINSPESWTRRAEGFGMRVGSSYAQYGVRETIELAMFAVHKEDPRYIRAGQGPARHRIGRILKSAVVARDPDGHDIPAINSFVGILGARAIANTWLPPEKDSASSVLISGAWGLLTKAAGNAFREFWPDVKKKFRGHN